MAITTTDVHLDRLARQALRFWRDTRKEVGVNYPPLGTWRKIDNTKAAARWDGFAEALIAQGYAMTPSGLWFDVDGIINGTVALMGERPAWRAMNNSGMKAWDDTAVRLMVEFWRLAA